jgi:CDP-diacylglycerol--serine O-phosphatidyltransferase
MRPLTPLARPDSLPKLVTLPNFVTSGNLTAGFLALLAVGKHPQLALALVLMAAVLDSLDGFLARRNGNDGAFGANLDSLADLVSFGIVPAMALYTQQLHRVPVLGLAVAVAFALCGGWRLARFPLVKDPHCFVGLPIPLAGVIALGLAIWSPSLIPVLIVPPVLSVLMVSSVSFPTVASCARGAAAVRSRALASRLDGR